MNAKLRQGVLFGAIAGVTTLVLNVANGALMSGSVCHRQGTPLPVLGFIVFTLLAGAAGRQASQRGGSAAIAGLLTGAISGIAILLLVAVSLGGAAQAASQCLQGTNTQGINVGAVASGFGLILAVLVYLVGLGIGAAAGALGAAIGGRPAASAQARHVK
ncbi:MAG: hypothetical protein ABI401_11400 [Candidatus Dormibacter sp.]